MKKIGFDEMTTGFGGVNKRFDRLEQDVDEIKLKLGSVAYRFELQELQ